MEKSGESSDCGCGCVQHCSENAVSAVFIIGWSFHMQRHSHYNH